MSSDNVTIDNTLGAVVVGFAVSCVVYGILLAQVFFYFSRYPSDKWLYKFIVLFILLLETLEEFFIGHVVYYYSVVNIGNPVALLTGTVTWSFISQQMMGAIVAAIVNSSFTVRVWRFSGHNWVVTGILMVLAIAHLATALVYTVKSFQLPGIFAIGSLLPFGTAALTTGLVTDISIAASLCYYLNKLRSGHKQADSLANALTLYAINTGVVTSIFGIITLILSHTMSHNFVFIATFFLLSKMYAISFLATLNTRRIITGRGTDRSHSDPASTGRNTLYRVSYQQRADERMRTPEHWNVDKDRDASGDRTSFPMNTFHHGGAV